MQVIYIHRRKFESHFSIVRWIWSHRCRWSQKTRNPGWEHARRQYGLNSRVDGGRTPGRLEKTFWIQPGTAQVVNHLEWPWYTYSDGVWFIRRGNWSAGNWGPMWMVGRGLTNSTVGIFGLGKIGMGVMQRLQGFKVRKFIYHDIVANNEGKWEFLRIVIFSFARQR